jgi:hypothetical protein
MALHRDIYWVGKQWAVTGHGIQACDQKQKSKFDIEASLLWDDNALENLRTQKWLNINDFDNALAAARKHYPEPARKPAPPEPREETTAPPVKASGLVEPPVPAALKFEMQVKSWPAKLVPLWRVRLSR